MEKVLNFLVLLLIISFGGCGEKEEDYAATYSIVVASEKRIVDINPTSDVHLAPCIMVKSKDLFYNDEWNPWNRNIEGFKYEEGYEYTLLVKMFINKDLVDDNDSYKLYKVVSKEKKNSIGLPDNRAE